MEKLGGLKKKLPMDESMGIRKMNLWGIPETAAFLRRSPSAVRKLVLRRKIPFRRVGGRICFLESEIITWVQQSPGKTLEELYAEGESTN